MREAIEAAGCQLVSLAAYSRDFHSIENAFAKRKALLGAKAKRSMHALLWDTLADRIALFKPQEWSHYFKVSGYGPA